ncbi:MAG: LysE family transporter [Porphyromonas sp.]|nr:LysE family transporter [Porphyromonas sp.]
MVFETFAKALIIGILVSAPMGPIGVLCIRRTLHKGQREGLLSGVGAAISDLVYATVTYLGVGIVMKFVENNNVLFTLLGSLLMLAFAFYLYYSRSSKDFEVNDPQSSDYMRTIGSSFLLTFSNPLIIFFFLALFTRFNIVPEALSAFGGYCLVMLGIAIGAFVWWYFITFVVSKLRDKISVIGLRWFNRIVALIFAVVSLVGIVSALLDFLHI